MFIQSVIHRLASHSSLLWETSLILLYCTHGILFRCVICLEAVQREWDPCIMIQKRGNWGRTMRRMDCGCFAWAPLKRLMLPERRQVLGAKLERRGKKKNKPFFSALLDPTSPCGQSVIQLFEKGCVSTGFEMFHRVSSLRKAPS